MYRGMMLAVLMAVAGNAVADESGTRVDLDGQFAAQRDAIFRELGDGKTYVEIEPEDRAQVLDALERMTAALEQAGGIAGLDEADKVAVFNDQELVNTILTEAGEDSRLICRRERKTGSHRTTTVCMTVAERRRFQKSADDWLRSRRNPMLEPKP